MAASLLHSPQRCSAFQCSGRSRLVEGRPRQKGWYLESARRPIELIQLRVQQRWQTPVTIAKDIALLDTQVGQDIAAAYLTCMLRRRKHTEVRRDGCSSEKRKNKSLRGTIRGHHEWRNARAAGLRARAHAGCLRSHCPVQRQSSLQRLAYAMQYSLQQSGHLSAYRVWRT